MPEIKIAKIKLRRGTNAQRKTVIIDQGEIIATTDTNRLYVGNGFLSGGISPASKIHPPVSLYVTLSTITAETGDLAMANNLFYQLTGTDSQILSGWGNISQKFDPVGFSYDTQSTLSLSNSALSANLFVPQTFGDGITLNNNVLGVDYNTKSLEISSGKISLKTSGIDEREIAPTTFTRGISGGGGEPVGLNFNTNQFYLSSGILNLSASLITDYNTTSMMLTSGVISVRGGITPSTRELSNTTIDQFGRVIFQESSIVDTLSCNSSLNSSNSLSSIFNGTPSHTLSGGIPGVEITKFEAISSNGVTTTVLTLSSAGFIIFDGEYMVQSGQTIGRFAVPIFAY